MEDLCGRKIDYLRISVTDLCNMRCEYCMPEKGVFHRSHKEILSFEEIVAITKAGAQLGIRKIRITGGEPLVRRGIVDLVRQLSSVAGIVDLAMTTNGQLLEEYAADLKEAGLNRVNISLDTFDPDKYTKITRGGNLEKVLKGIEAAERAGLRPIKINTVLIGDFNDDEIETFVCKTMDKSYDVRFIELMPIGEAASWAKKHFISNATVLEKMPKLEKIDAQEGHSPATYYALPKAKGRVGLINPISNHFCHACNRIRLTADGRLKPCLHSDYEVDIKKALRSGEDIVAVFKNAVNMKPVSHHMGEEGYVPVSRNMHQIGG